MISGDTDVIIIEKKCTVSVMLLNHPEITPYPVCGKTVFHETGPWCQRGWDHCLRGQWGDRGPCHGSTVTTPLHQLQTSVSFSQLVPDE